MKNLIIFGKMSCIGGSVIALILYMMKQFNLIDTIYIIMFCGLGFLLIYLLDKECKEFY